MRFPWKVWSCLSMLEMSHLIKPTKRPLCPGKTQISLGICPIWSVFAVRMKKHWVFSYPLSGHQSLWSDWADAQADRSLRWVHRSFWFRHAVAQMVLLCNRKCFLHFLRKMGKLKSWSKDLVASINNNVVYVLWLHAVLYTILWWKGRRKLPFKCC